MTVREGYQPIKNNKNPHLKGNLDPNNPPGKSVIEFKATELGKRVTIEINVKAKRIMEFKFKTWVSFLLIRLASRILKAAIITDIIDNG
jgi:NifU-like protein involved in Fe-S cluster formation